MKSQDFPPKYPKPAGPDMRSIFSIEESGTGPERHRDRTRKHFGLPKA